MEEQSLAPEETQQKIYHSPAIIHELDLETRAGSPIGGGNAPILPLPGDDGQLFP